MKTYMFIYFLSTDMDKVRQNLGRHVKYWKSREFAFYKNGPFADKSGGLILFSAADDGQAQAIVAQDPLIQEEVLTQYWLKEWVA